MTIIKRSVCIKSFSISFIFVTSGNSNIISLSFTFNNFSGIIARMERWMRLKTAAFEKVRVRSCRRGTAGASRGTSERGNKSDELPQQAIAYARTLVFHSSELLAMARRVVTVKENDEEAARSQCEKLARVRRYEFARSDLDVFEILASPRLIPLVRGEILDYKLMEKQVWLR